MFSIIHFNISLCRREGTTEEQDLLASYSDYAGQSGAGSGINERDAQRLAETLALNAPSGKTAAPAAQSATASNDQTSQYFPPKTSQYFPPKRSAIVDQPEKRSEIAGKAPSSDTINRTDFMATLAGKSDNKIDEILVRAVQNRFHYKPVIGMTIRCKVAGKKDRLKGFLRYLGHIENLPIKKKNLVVAGVELDHDEDLGTDGTFLGKRYFSTPSKRGYFVPVKNCGAGS